MECHLATVRPHQTVFDRTENFFLEIPMTNYISEAVSSFFQNLTFFYFYKKVPKGSLENSCLGFQNPINPDGKVRNENSRFYFWRILGSIYGKNFSPVEQIYAKFFSYLVILFFPFVCILPSPELRNKMKVILSL
jgi:hypothetical protein